MAGRMGPSDRELERFLQQGLSYQEIADRYGVTPNAIATIAHRAGLSSPRLRYRVAALWSPIRDEHSSAYELNMLRARERQIRGHSITPRVAGRLASFLEKLEAANGVIGYAPETTLGFFLLDRDDVPAEIIDKELPIITERLTLETLTKILSPAA